jgi:hypothetical protein
MRLRQVEIPVLEESGVDSPSYPSLYYVLNVTPAKVGSRIIGYFYLLRLHVKQLTCLFRDKSCCLSATTWQAIENSGTVPSLLSMREAIRGDLSEMMDEFINDYLKQNPMK